MQIIEKVDRLSLMLILLAKTAPTSTSSARLAKGARQFIIGCQLQYAGKGELTNVWHRNERDSSRRNDSHNAHMRPGFLRHRKALMMRQALIQRVAEFTSYHFKCNGGNLMVFEQREEREQASHGSGYWQRGGHHGGRIAGDSRKRWRAKR